MLTNLLSKLYNEFFESEKTGGLILIICTVLSIVAANSFFGDMYAGIWHRKLDLSFPGIHLNYSLQHWINDGLMAVFFLLVGLEIKRELYVGELSNIKSAALPVIAALGGMIVPAIIHFIFNHGTPTMAGIGIPMATDIAFSLGVLSLLGRRVPVSLKIFLTAFAIIDDLGAIIIIALFYSKDISVLYLALASGIFIVLIIFNRLRFNRIALYAVLGTVMWYCMLKSGIHATITGVLLAFAVPFNKDDGNPSSRLQHFLHRPVAYIILPLFAIANTGIILNYAQIENLLSVNALGIMLGLFAGKPLGVLLFSIAGIMLKICRYPMNVNWRHLLGAGMLGGIGFTMSIFITNLAYTEHLIIQSSILSILIASLASGVLGFVFLKTIRS
ncbi:MAG: Na+/H+ antiporter NhaA [Spirochaetes bacterium]|nr:Na+/H+ antiporter NhaA [Spirochaetota bacterium]